MLEKELAEFLVRAKQAGYAAGSNAFTKEEDGSYSTRFEEGDFRFHDNWFGGEPFGGREVVFYQNKPFWMMVYYGEDEGRVSGVINVLRKALSNVPEHFPVRGPRLFEDGNITYQNEWKGTLARFQGDEEIRHRVSGQAYRAHYGGGFINKRAD